MGLMSWLGKTIGNSAGEMVEKVGSTVDRFVTTEEDRMRAEQLKQELRLDFKKLEMEAEQKYFEDRQNAREMYMQDSGLQKMFAMTFLVAYVMITAFMLWFLFDQILTSSGLDIPSWGVSLISSIFGAMSAKVNTIVDFLFGGSQGERNTSDKITKSFEEGRKKEQ